MTSKQTIKAVAAAGALILTGFSGFLVGNSKSMWFQKLPPTAKQAVFDTQNNVQRELEACIQLIQQNKLSEAVVRYRKLDDLLESLEQSSPVYGLLKYKVERFDHFLFYFEQIVSHHQLHLKNQERLFAYYSQHKTSAVATDGAFVEIIMNMAQSLRFNLDITQMFAVYDIEATFEKTHDSQLCQAMCTAFDAQLAEDEKTVELTMKTLRQLDVATSHDSGGSFQRMYGIYVEKMQTIKLYRKILQDLIKKY